MPRRNLKDTVQDKTSRGWQLGGGGIQGVLLIAVVGTTERIASRDAYNLYWLLSYTPGAGYGGWVHLEGVFSTETVKPRGGRRPVICTPIGCRDALPTIIGTVSERPEP
jgi:hypothetical protein